MSISPPDPIYQLMDNDHQGIYSLQAVRYPYLLTGMGDGTVMMWDCHSGKSCVSLRQDDRFPIIGIEHLNDNLIVQTKDGLITVYNTRENFKYVTEKLLNYLGFCKVKTNPSHGGILLCPLNDSFEMLSWNHQLPVMKICTPENAGAIMDMQFVDKGHLEAVVGYESGLVIFWDLRNSKELSRLTYKDNPMAIDFESESGIGFLGNETDLIHTFSIDSNQNTLVHKKDIKITNEGVSNIRIRPDKKLLAITSWDNRIRLFSVKKQRPLAVLNGHKKTIQDLIFTKNFVNFGQNKFIMISGCLDGNILFWDIYN